MAEKEIWKSIKGYEGLYEASNTGRIRSLPRWGTSKEVKILKLMLRVDKRPRFNKPYKRYSVLLHKNGNPKTIMVSRIIAIAFIPNPENKAQVNHIDGNPLNNNYKNLEWVTLSENLKHAFKLGLKIPASTIIQNNKLKQNQYGAAEL